MFLDLLEQFGWDKTHFSMATTAPLVGVVDSGESFAIAKVQFSIATHQRPLAATSEASTDE